METKRFESELWEDQLPPADAKGVDGNPPDHQQEGVDHGTVSDAVSTEPESAPKPKPAPKPRSKSKPKPKTAPVVEED